MMKKLVISFFLFFGIMYSQEKVDAKNVKYDGNYYLYMSSNSYLGKNYIANQYKNNLGLGFDYTFLKYKNFNAGIGFEYNSLIENEDKIFKSSSKIDMYSVKFLIINYHLPINQNFTLLPNFQYSFSRLNFIDLNAEQNGNNFRIGLNLRHRLISRYYVFGGINYNYLFLNVNASPEKENFYNHTNYLTFNLGFNLD